MTGFRNIFKNSGISFKCLPGNTLSHRLEFLYSAILALPEGFYIPTTELSMSSLLRIWLVSCEGVEPSIPRKTYFPPKWESYSIKSSRLYKEIVAPNSVNIKPIIFTKLRCIMRRFQIKQRKEKKNKSIKINCITYFFIPLSHRPN